LLKKQVTKKYLLKKDFELQGRGLFNKISLTAGFNLTLIYQAGNE